MDEREPWVQAREDSQQDKRRLEELDAKVKAMDVPTDLDEEDATALATRARACVSWLWMPGMLLWPAELLSPPIKPHRLDRRDLTVGTWFGQGEREGDRLRGFFLRKRLDQGRPILEDPATLGCLEALVRRVWGDVVITRGPDRWSVASEAAGEVWDEGSTSCYQEALICALEASPGEEGASYQDWRLSRGDDDKEEEQEDGQ